MGRNRVQPRCPRCLLHVPLCLCASLPRIPVTTRIVLVPHAVEWRQASNTGRVAALTLEGAEVAVWGRRDAPLDPTALAGRDGVRTVLLFPTDGAPPLGPIDERPVRILVPDGTWRQGRRIARKLSVLPGVERARVAAPPQPNLRKAPSDERLGTGEAIAAALEALGELEAAHQLRDAVRTMVDRTLYVRGRLAADRVKGGVSAEARRAMSGPR